MNKVTCSLCEERNDEAKWGDHLASIERLKVCKEEKI